MSEIQELAVLGNIILTMVIVLLILSYVTVGLRLWVRYRITKTPGWDDMAMVATLMLFTCYCAFIAVIKVRGSEAKLFDLKDFHATLVYIQLSEVFYILTTTTLKISLGLFFLRVLTKRWQTLLFHIVLGASATYGLFYVLTTIFACGNPARFADTLLGSQKCFPRGFILATGYLYGTINILADWLFVLIPICVLIDSKLDRRSKISVSVVMALGAIGSISSIMRMVFLDGLLLNSSGITPKSIKATIWATAEPGTGIVAASIAILRPLVRDITTSVRTHASGIHSRKSSQLTEDSDTIGLTSNIKVSTRVYATYSEAPPSPTLPANTIPRKALSVKLTNGRGAPVVVDKPPQVPNKDS